MCFVAGLERMAACGRRVPVSGSVRVAVWLPVWAEATGVYGALRTLIAVRSAPVSCASRKSAKQRIK